MKLSPKVRFFLVDTLAMTLLTSVPAAVVEFYLLGLPAERVIGVRTFAGAMGLLTGGVYGRCRDYAISRFVGEHGSPRRRFLVDVIVNMSFTVILYPLQLWMFDATGTQIFWALLIALLSCILVGPITGFFLDAVRRAAEKTPAFLRRLRLLKKPVVQDTAA